MISFEELTRENADDIKAKLAKNISGIYSTPYGNAYGEISDAIDILLSDIDDFEYGVCDYGGYLLIRVFDMGRYYFISPYQIAENADPSNVIPALMQYTAFEEIPLVVTEVEESAMRLFSGYRHLSLDASDPECTSYTVRVQTECELVDEIPEKSWGRVDLNEISEDDIPLFAALSKDENVNNYWGYNYSAEIKDPSDRYFYDVACGEFASGAALNFAVRYGGTLVGHAVLYAFDGKGGAELAIRISAEKQRQGIASAAFRLLAEAAAEMGLVRLRASVMRENIPSLRFFNKFMRRVREDMETVFFEYGIYD